MNAIPFRNEWIVALLVLALLAAAPATARTTEEDFEFRGQPDCRWFLLMQGGVSGRLDHGSQENNYGNTAFLAHVGLMRNLVQPIGTTQALGGNVFVTAGDHRTVGGVQVRYRRWHGGEVDGAGAVCRGARRVVWDSCRRGDLRARHADRLAQLRWGILMGWGVVNLGGAPCGKRSSRWH